MIIKEHGWRTGTWRGRDEQVGADLIAEHSIRDVYAAETQWPRGFKLQCRTMCLHTVRLTHGSENMGLNSRASHSHHKFATRKIMKRMVWRFFPKHNVYQTAGTTEY